MRFNQTEPGHVNETGSTFIDALKAHFLIHYVIHFLMYFPFKI